jgi:hypothetical protein
VGSQLFDHVQIAVWENKTRWPPFRGAALAYAFGATRLICLDGALAPPSTVWVEVRICVGERKGGREGRRKDGKKEGLGFMVWGVGCRFQDLGFRVSFFGRNMSLESGCKMLVLRFVRPTYGVF